jgi:hypothetical protein
MHIPASQSKDGGFRVVPEGLYNGTWLNVSLFTQGVEIGTVQNIGSLATDDTKTDEEKFQNLLLSWGKLLAEQGIHAEGVLRELEKTATFDDRGFAEVTFPREGVNENNYRGLKRDAVKGHRRFLLLVMV